MKIFALVFAALVLLTSCIVVEEPGPSEPVAPAEASQPTETSNVDVAEPTTPREWPSFTRREITGVGDDIVVLDSPIRDIAVATATGSTELRQFTVWSIGEDGEPIDLLVNTIAPYTGTVLLEGWVDPVLAFEVTASGPWSIVIDDLNSVPTIQKGEPFVGTGDTVLVSAPTSGLTTLSVAGGDAERQLTVWTLGDTKDLPINTLSPYEGTVRIASLTELFAITATGEWSFLLN